jgi:hypothetical protein
MTRGAVRIAGHSVWPLYAGGEFLGKLLALFIYDAKADITRKNSTKHLIMNGSECVLYGNVKNAINQSI